ncbi:UDP-N-acetylmuramate dehydrogenase [Marinomonas sp. 2405UD68-3]|uniref:UDP-N-acetylmuramate dehydrogenase n=1 Tax=Marinomonas sp. 2405UD68-3 TaxID=3391835 RepID=UPI0039C930C7
MSLSILTDHSLQRYNSFGFDYRAEYFCIIHTLDDLIELSEWVTTSQCSLIVIGSGSNLLIQGNIKGIVAVNALKGRSFSAQGVDECLFEVAAGENWHDVVRSSVQEGWYGIENLALIPGTAGAAPVQNIGAYGVEIKDTLKEIQVFHLETKELSWVDAEACHFSYRESRFKHEWKSTHIITALRLSLSKKAKPILSYFHEGEFSSAMPSPLEVFERVSDIRRSKLPDPSELGNAGSFFKNPIVTDETYQKLKMLHPNVVSYPQGDCWKLAAGWLIDQAGWKGKHFEGVGVYAKQALVMVNYSETTADNLIILQNTIIEDIKQQFGVELEREPILLG